MDDWRSVDTAHLPTHPSMLGVEENKFLYWWIKEKYTGHGEILDVGGYLGGSAACLAKGLQDNTIAARKPRIQSFDFFTYTKRFYPAAFEEAGLQEGDSTIPLIRGYLGPLADRVALIAGDICDNARHVSAPTEFLFLDFTQNWMHHDAVVRYLYPNLIPGRAVLAHQDCLYVLCYWLHIYMELWADYFELISRAVGGEAGGTAAWRLVKALPERATLQRMADYLSFEEMEALLDRSLSHYPEDIHAGHLGCAKMRFLMHTGQYDRARAYGDVLRQRYAQHAGLSENVKIASDEIAAFEASRPYDSYFHNRT